MKHGRTTKSIRNIKYAIIGQATGIVINFINRMVFLHTLSIDYLGINGLFSNILSLLALADLGVGAAIVYSLYKPLAEKDNYKVKALMTLYKRIYVAIGTFIGILGIVITPFLKFLISDIPNIPNISLIFILFVINSATSYFLSYKRSLIIADQKRYITTFYRYTFFLGLNIIQIIFLFLTHNFIIYLLLQVINTLLENIFVSNKANKLYPFLKETGQARLDKNEKHVITRNIKAMMFHRIGGVVVSGTDNILISKLVGIKAVGIYSNYFLITNALNMVIGLIFQAITASIGNLTATENNNEKTIRIFGVLNFMGFWIYGFCSICLLLLFNPFIEIWLGEDFLFHMPIILVIVCNFFLTGMRKSVLSFRDAFGIYWNDRFKPLFESVINLVVSIFLGIHYGVIGIFIGTAISTLTTCFWVEPYVLYKYGFASPVREYFKKYFHYTFVLIFTGIISYWFSEQILFEGVAGFFIKMSICIIIPNLFFFLFFFRTVEFKHLWNVFSSMLLKKI
ncbi:lipopolysaccharide biosynthesis protein [Paenibacillus sabinae]|uniref:Polysaccharide biosynthesis protein n=1 Tax=Paenibacillus sabinae T27 TaxID=1268072 RepID=X5A444_9BACL|nr:hypothetical protein [Paenibacillus sabinae]AHV98589.1 polysaccharide biosynthesis protein [Paenibacillus sabinae T27]